MKHRITDAHDYGDKKVFLYRTEAPTAEAEYAFNLLEKWGLVAAEIDGEDTAGRTRLRLSTPGEVVARAFEVSALAFSVARQRGLMVSVPDLNEINAEQDAERATKAAAKKEKERV